MPTLLYQTLQKPLQAGVEFPLPVGAQPFVLGRREERKLLLHSGWLFVVLLESGDLCWSQQHPKNYSNVQQRKKTKTLKSSEFWGNWREKQDSCFGDKNKASREWHLQLNLLKKPHFSVKFICNMHCKKILVWTLHISIIWQEKFALWHSLNNVLCFLSQLFTLSKGDVHNVSDSVQT